MPFTKFINITENSHTNDPDELPIFLIPGILGNGDVELQALAQALNEERQGKTPIYIYVEPEDNKGMPIDMSLEEHSKRIAEEIKEIRQNSPLPYILGGYSFGGILAAKTAHELTSSGLQTHLFVIDQPAAPEVKSRIKPNQRNNNKQLSVMNDMIAVTNYAARLSGLEPIQFDSEFLEIVQNYAPQERFDRLRDNLLNNQPGKNGEQFRKAFENDTGVCLEKLPDALMRKLTMFLFYMETAKRNLRNILQSTNDSDTLLLQNLSLIFSKETALKYGATESNWKDFTGGWEKECSSPNIISTPHLNSAKHLDLLKDESAWAIAKQISKTLRSTISKGDLLTNNLQPFMKELLVTNPHIRGEEVQQILKNLLTGNRVQPQRVSRPSPVRFFQELRDGEVQPIAPSKGSKANATQVLNETRASITLTNSGPGVQ